MRVAAIYDIHGNLPALEAVLEEIQRAGVEIVIVGGDLLPGPMPRETLECLLNLNIPVQFIQGNCEIDALAEMTGTGVVRFPEQVREIMRWSAQQIFPEYKQFVASWAKTLRIEIGGLGTVLFCHATPRDDNEIYLNNDLIVIVLSNRRTRAGSLRRYAMPQVVNIALLNKSPQLPAFVNVSTAKLRRSEGTYRLDSSREFYVNSEKAVIENGKTKIILIISGRGQKAIDLPFSANQLPDLTKLSPDLNDKIEKYIKALRDDDENSLKKILFKNSSATEQINR